MAAMTFPGPVREGVPMASLTTLAVGGPARWLAEAATEAELARWLGFAREAGVQAFVLGGGSNLLVADSGFDGLVVRCSGSEVALEDLGDGRVRVTAEAGGEWDALVERAVAEDLAGIECLSGIPGRIGAAPIQNIGAYGQEIAETLEGLRAVDRATGRAVAMGSADCGFGYRWSRFKGEWRERFAITRVSLVLRRGGEATVRYPDLANRFDGARPPLGEVREQVLSVRRGKSMVYDPADPNHRSAGSFFLNPIVPEAVAHEVIRRTGEAGMPRYPAGPGRVKLSAAWLLEQAGFRKGLVRGRAGLSTRHVLALVNRGGASAAEIVALAGELRRGVEQALGVRLVPEPHFLGFGRTVDELLA